MSKRPKKAPTLSYIDAVIGKLREPSTFRYSSYVEYEYDTYRACQEGSDCCNNDYCRCGKIINTSVTSVNFNSLLEFLSKDYEEDVITTYCIDRILRVWELYDTSNWEVKVGGGYYGEEVYGVSLNQNVIDSICTSLKEIEPLSDIDKVKKCLQYEYGYVLPIIETAQTAKICTLKMEEIKLFNDTYSKKISKKSISYYELYDLPRAVCIKVGDKYQVVDGYHRALAAQTNGNKEITIIVLS